MNSFRNHNTTIPYNDNNAIFPFSTPTNILSRFKSSMITNTLIPGLKTEILNKSEIFFNTEHFSGLGRSYYETFINNNYNKKDMTIVIIFIILCVLFLKLI